MLMKTMLYNYHTYLIPCRVGLTKAESFFYQENLKNSSIFFSENHLQTLLHFIEKLGMNYTLHYTVTHTVHSQN